jgi:hypothetical protein
MEFHIMLHSTRQPQTGPDNTKPVSVSHRVSSDVLQQGLVFFGHTPADSPAAKRTGEVLWTVCGLQTLVSTVMYNGTQLQECHCWTIRSGLEDEARATNVGLVPCYIRSSFSCSALQKNGKSCLSNPIWPDGELPPRVHVLRWEL